MYDPTKVKADFPIFQQAENANLVYLDNAATTQKPQVVIDAIADYYKNSNANVHRGVHRLSDESTKMWLDARQTIADFFGAKSSELIITRNTTEAINGVAYGWGDYQLKTGDVILSTQMEHHANLVPWQELCRRTGAELKIIPVLPDGRLDSDWYQAHLTKKVKLVALQQISNALGTLHPVNWYIDLAQTMGARVLIDAAQSAPHLPINFSKMRADFLVFSGHKMLGPMGIGGLLVREEILKSGEMQPWLFGGGMISQVSEASAEYHLDPSERFTAGTPDVASTVGLAAACTYLHELDMRMVLEHDQSLVMYTLDKLTENEKITLLGVTASAFVDTTPVYELKGEFPQLQIDRVGSVSFLYKGVHPHDVAQVLDSENVAVRSGHHCCMPLHTKFAWPGSIRASFSVYSSKQDVDHLVLALEKVATVFG
jgi:cysteine desulfurase/selenocysteine lyase